MSDGTEAARQVHKPEWERRRWSVRVEFKPQDCWIGVFWKCGGFHELFGEWVEPAVDIWVVLIPCFPIHVTTKKRRYL